MERRILFAAYTISSGQTIASALSGTQSDVYAFQAPVGSTFEISVGAADASSGMVPSVMVFNTNAVEVAGAATHTTDSAVRPTYTVPAGTDGRFNAVVQNATGATGGNYDVELVVVPATQARDISGDGGALLSDQSKISSIQRPGDLDIWTFSASPNDTFGVTLDTPNSASLVEPDLLLYDPAGKLIDETSNTITNSTVGIYVPVPANGGGTYTAVAQDRTGSGTGNYTISLTGATPGVTTPTVTTNPLSQTVLADATVTFNASASGNPTPSVQWQMSSDGGASFLNIVSNPSATTTTLTLASQDYAPSGVEVRAVFTNSNGSATSTAATLTRQYAPSVTLTPSNTTVTSGASATFTAAATGTPTPTVQWQVSTNGGSTFANITGNASATTTTLTLPQVVLTQSGAEYRAVFTNAIGTAWTGPATLIVNAPTQVPDITNSPVSQIVAVGQDVTFTAGSVGNPIPSVQWMVKTPSANSFVPVTGITPVQQTSGVVTTSTIDLGSATLAENGNLYEAVFTNGVGSPATTSPATLAVSASGTQPVITSDPTSQTITAGNTATFTASATGNPTPTVQWLFSTNGGTSYANVTGNASATTTTLTLTGVAVTQTGTLYRALFTNTAGSMATAAARLNVNAAATSGSLAGSASTAAASYNLTQLGTSDWAHFGATGYALAYDHKATGGAQISNVTRVGAGGYGGFTDASRTVNWTDGSPAATDSAEHGYLWANNAIGAGYSFTAPADTTTRTIYVYLGGNSSGSTLTAHLSDNSAADYSVNLSGTGIYNDVVAITYHAASANQKLTLTYTKTQNINGTGGSVDLVGAWLVNSAPANTAPVITGNPAAVTVAAGNTATFTAFASGTPTPTVQWQVSTNGGSTFSNITGNVSATTTSLSLPGVAVTQTGTLYRAVFTNAAGSVTTNSAILTVGSAAVAPVVISNPTTQTVASGSTVTLTAAATGNPTPTVQWQLSTDNRTFTNITGNASATTTSLILPNVTTAQIGTEYRAVFTNTAGSATTNTATLAVTVTSLAPAITTNPTSATVAAGGTATFTAAATGTPTPTVQWQVSTNGGSTFANITGNASATTGTLSLATVAATQSGTEYRAVFTNAAGSATSSTVLLTVNTATSAPVIATNPSSQTIASLDNVEFSANATGNPAPTVQWQISANGGTSYANISDNASATTNTLQLQGSTTADSGEKYRAVFTNSAGSVTSGAATLTVNPEAPEPFASPSNVVANAGQTATFTASSFGDPIPTVQWQVSTNGGSTFTNITASASATATSQNLSIVAMSTTLTLTGLATTQNGTEYRAVFTNSAGSTATSAATLTVNAVVAGNGSLSGTSSVASGTYNLTQLGTSDWAHFGATGYALAYDHKATGGAQISNVTRVGAGGYGGFTDVSRTVNWTDGSPAATDSAEHGYLWANNAIGAGYSFTAPADTTTRTIYVYVGGNSSGSTLTAHLSDNSAADYSVNLSGTGIYNDVVAITYHAASANQKLTLTYTKTQNINGTGGSVDLVGAWLGGVAASSAPIITSNPTNQTVNTVVGVDSPVTFTASANGNPAPTVQWQATDQLGNYHDITGNASATTPTLTVSVNPNQNGVKYRAVFTNGSGSATTNAATLTVNDVSTPPTVTANPTSATVTAGNTATFTAAASGTPTPTVQWQVSTNSGSTFSNITGNASATTTTLTLPGVSTTQSGTEYRAVFTGAGDSVTTTAATLTVNPVVAGKGALAGGSSTAAPSYNLTQLGTSDWAHFGATGYALAYDHKAAGGSQISNVTRVGAGNYGGFTDASRTVSWTDGTPAATDSAEHGYLWANNAIGAGYSFTVPADTTTRTLYVYAGGFSTGSTLTAHLSDGSAADYNVSFSNTGTYSDLITITYNAASAGQKLTITYTKSQNINGAGGSADLMGAWLT